MIDLHSHVIFDIDDGAQNLEDSLEILKKAQNIGITKIMATPHFSVGEDVSRFLKKRKENLDRLKEACDKERICISLKAGAEVYITDELFNESDLDKLVMGDSKVILSEFKYHSLSGEKFLEYIDYILDEGFTPLIAHVERYSFIRRNMMLLESLLSRGVMLQINALSLYDDGEEGDFARLIVDEKLVNIIASDIHHVPSRRYRAMEKLRDFDDEYIQVLLNKNPGMIFDSVESFRR